MDAGASSGIRAQSAPARACLDDLQRLDVATLNLVEHLRSRSTAFPFPFKILWARINASALDDDDSMIQVMEPTCAMTCEPECVRISCIELDAVAAQFSRLFLRRSKTEILVMAPR